MWVCIYIYISMAVTKNINKSSCELPPTLRIAAPDYAKLDIGV